jgi:hypothetical protein
MENLEPSRFIPRVAVDPAFRFARDHGLRQPGAVHLVLLEFSV